MILSFGFGIPKPSKQCSFQCSNASITVVRPASYPLLGSNLIMSSEYRTGVQAAQGEAAVLGNDSDLRNRRLRLPLSCVSTFDPDIGCKAGLMAFVGASEAAALIVNSPRASTSTKA
jgi:hypothetical protein